MKTTQARDSGGADALLLAKVRSSRSRWSGRPIVVAATLAALAIALNVPTAAMADPSSLGNGNFEAPPHPGYTNIPSPGTIGAWKVISGSVDHGTGPAATPCQTPGGQCVDLNGNSKGKISQDIKTCQPKFRVHFYMSRHAALGNQEATLVASIGTHTFPFKHALPVLPGVWVAHEFDFVGSSMTSIPLAFESTTNATDPRAGPQIDNVTIKLLSCDYP